jgi:hypothetical protein
MCKNNLKWGLVLLAFGPDVTLRLMSAVRTTITFFFVLGVAARSTIFFVTCFLVRRIIASLKLAAVPAVAYPAAAKASLLTWLTSIGRSNNL